jgi:hypothetical protein
MSGKFAGIAPFGTKLAYVLGAPNQGTTTLGYSNLIILWKGGELFRQENRITLVATQVFLKAIRLNCK